MLLLRKECQPLLDAVGLGNLHIEVQDKCVVLVGECGKPLVSVKGISFSKPTINSVEREYAVELFDKFLAKYATDINTYITAKQAYALVIPPTMSFDFVLGTNTVGYGTNMRTHHSASFKVTFDTTTINVTVTEFGVTFSGAIPVAELETLADRLRDNICAADAYITDIGIYTDEGKRIEELRNKLAACDI